MFASSELFCYEKLLKGSLSGGTKLNDDSSQLKKSFIERDPHLTRF